MSSESPGDGLPRSDGLRQRYGGFICATAAIAGTTLGVGAARAVIPRSPAAMAFHGAAGQPGRLAVGATAPDFILADGAGAAYQLSALRGRKVVLCFFCGCANCRHIAPVWERLHRSHPEMRVLGVSSLHPDEIRAWQKQTGATFVALFDPDHRVAAAYAAAECPTTWVIDPGGRIEAGWHAGVPPDARGASTPRLGNI